MIDIKYILGLLFVLFACSCSVTKNIPENDALYTGSTIKLKPANDSIKFNSKELKEELDLLLRPKPNASILGMIYNFAGTPTGHGLRYWLKNKVGEPPVLGSSVNLNKNRQILENRLENHGYFRSEVTADTSVKKKQLKVTYTASVNPQYKIRTVKYEVDSTPLGRQLTSLSKYSFLKPGNPYDLDVIKAERERIDTRVKERGFYFFNPDFLTVDVDSTVGNSQVDMYVKLKKETPPKAEKIYRINDIVVYADYNLENDTSAVSAKAQAVKYDYYYIYDPEQKFNPKIFSRMLVFKPGNPYNRTAHNLALNRLVSLGVYKFVRARFQEVDTSRLPLLNAFYYLTPAKKKSLRFELSGLTKSNNSTGTELSLTWRNRNFLKSAELFSVKLFGGLEKQVSAQQPTINTNRLGIELNLLMPRIISPIRFSTNSNFVPQTKATLGYELFERNTQYTLSSSKASFGYIWKEDIRKEHQLDIISLNLVQPRSVTAEFQQALDTNITLARSIEKQFIIGSNYNFNYNSQARPNIKKNNFYFNGNLDVSANIIGLLSGADVEAGKQKGIFGVPFSQYIRTEAELRHYLKFSKTKMLASRVLAGIGYAYGNSTTLPFIKSFFAGGANDIRAFRARSLGPGSYYAGNAGIVGFLPDQPGDIKIELNTEFRAKLFSVFYGALFIDAGNIWLLRDDPSKPGSKFTNKFLNDFAAGAGAGLRIDVSFFVLRLDVAFPIRKPYILEGSKWVLKDINFGSSDWRKQNLVYNLAIGYPF
ncbi:MAG: BamA/TamA family outer membrane protein [Panacibacter sp.]